jgi:spore germination protein
LKKTGDTASFENIDYTKIGFIADRIIFLKNTWGINSDPPAPISNITLIREFIKYITSKISSDIVSMGKPLIGYDWELPFIPGKSRANSLSLTAALTLAYDEGVAIQFDEESQTPFFNYTRSNVGAPENHIVWFIDARSMKALDDVIIEYNLVGSGIWNISNYYQQMWSLINAIFNIVKFPNP